jgi:hypothetical protein
MEQSQREQKGRLWALSSIKVRQLCAQKVVSKVALKYTVLKVRQKISFHAAQR